MTVHGNYEYGGIIWYKNMGKITSTIYGDDSGFNE